MHANRYSPQDSLVDNNAVGSPSHDLGSPSRVSRALVSPMRNRYLARGAYQSPIRYSGSPERRRTIAELEAENKRPTSSLSVSSPKKHKSVAFLAVPNLEYHHPAPASPAASAPVPVQAPIPISETTSLPPPQPDLSNDINTEEKSALLSILRRLDNIERTQQLILQKMDERDKAERNSSQQMRQSIDIMRLEVERMGKHRR